MPCSIKVDPHREKKISEKSRKFAESRCFSFAERKIKNFEENLDFSFFELKTLLFQSNFNALSPSFFSNIPIFRVEKDSVIEKWVIDSAGVLIF